ncbi:basic proline-rich protein-like [Antechinus flavipes]|uniref:basic proline-rich protein-like n=1 Tax=Antechinus flavipes TaxID=38775 RepID=UPI0022367F40|nr:basic proline-rich protein-like [Antechinus flavipes]
MRGRGESPQQQALSVGSCAPQQQALSVAPVPPSGRPCPRILCAPQQQALSSYPLCPPAAGPIRGSCAPQQQALSVAPVPPSGRPCPWGLVPPSSRPCPWLLCPPAAGPVRGSCAPQRQALSVAPVPPSSRPCPWLLCPPAAGPVRGSCAPQQQPLWHEAPQNLTPTRPRAPGGRSHFPHPRGLPLPRPFLPTWSPEATHLLPTYQVPQRKLPLTHPAEADAQQLPLALKMARIGRTPS